MGAAQTYQRITVPTLWVAVALSLALHALLLFGWLPVPKMLPFEDTKEGKPGGSIAIRIAPAPKPPAPPPAPESRPQPPAPQPKPAAPKPAQKSAPPKPPPAPEVLALQRPAERASPPVPANDLAAYVEARRRAREASDAQSRPPSPPAPPSQQQPESEEARRERIVAANLGLDRPQAIGTAPTRGGGIFQIARVTSEEAEFFFYGWNKAIRRNSPQMIEVRRGAHLSIEAAIVQRMIAIIREQSSGDFQWESKRLGRDITLSARIADNAKLEEFLLREFFSVRTSPR